HGSFGATPKPVFDVYQSWQRRLERQPVSFIDKELPGHLENARQVLGDYLNAGASDLVYVPNATFGVNVVARSLNLGPGDEVLATNHEYGACSRVWGFLSQKRGFDVIQQSIPVPLPSSDESVELFWKGVSERTRVIFISHITSPTAQHLPVEAICARARRAGILTLVDGAHALGQIPLDMQAVGADFYTGNGHKWLCSPKGSAFLYTRPEKQALIEPLVVGWGWGEERVFTFGSDYLDYLQWLGTNDLAAYLSVPAAIQFQSEHNWSLVRQQCHELLEQSIRRICGLTGLESVYPNGGDSDHQKADADHQPSFGFHQMAIAPLPHVDDVNLLKRRLYEAYRIEIPLIEWEAKQFIRVSIQGYNSQSDVDALIEGLAAIL
ncbi:MAG: aminotransferase class V-fold PLP-dependent enzyme, partial [Candidatus Promineifilaceae bacterium]